MFTRFLDIILGFVKRPLSEKNSSPSQQRRVQGRADCRFVVQCFSQASSFTGIVRNLGTNGLMLALARDIRPGTTLTIRWSNEDGEVPVHARVLWCRLVEGVGRHEVGVRFLDPVDALERSWVKQVLAQGEQPRSACDGRESCSSTLVSALAEVEKPSGRAAVCGNLLDINRTGAMFESSHMFGIGETLRLRVAWGSSSRLVLSGRVVQRILGNHGMTAGIEFHELASTQLQDLDALLGSLRPARAA